MAIKKVKAGDYLVVCLEWYGGGHIYSGRVVEVMKSKTGKTVYDLDCGSDRIAALDRHIVSRARC